MIDEGKDETSVGNPVTGPAVGSVIAFLFILAFVVGIFVYKR
jgi:hypothetical protein